MSESVTVGVVQCALGGSLEQNLARVGDGVRHAAAQGAQVLVLPELLEGPYFCQDQRIAHFARARPLAGHATVAHLAQLARELSVVLPVPFFEQDGPHYYNSVAVLDADGNLLGVYRKNHIPDGPGYQEKYYFRPGNSGYPVWSTRYGKIGVGICWDQWFPETARELVLGGAELLLYPTAIGSEPDTGADTQAQWQLAMLGHAVHNRVPVAAANRVGREGDAQFYGSSFVADDSGRKLVEMGRDESGVRVATLDLAAAATARAAWGFFRDRRPETYRRQGLVPAS